MTRIVIADLPTARELVAADQFGFVLSLMSPGSRHRLALDADRVVHQLIEVDDITDGKTTYPPPYQPPTAAHAHEIVSFGQRWSRQGGLLVHCAQGRSRSAAAGLIIASMFGPTDPIELGLRLRRAGPHLDPNPRLVYHADTVMGGHGKLLIALGAMRSPTTKGVQAPAALEV